MRFIVPTLLERNEVFGPQRYKTCKFLSERGTF